MAVNRCICHKITFADALTLAAEHRCATVAELGEHCALGSGCGLCVPYMQRALRTGEVDLPVLDVAETAYWMERSGLIPEGEG